MKREIVVGDVLKNEDMPYAIIWEVVDIKSDPGVSHAHVDDFIHVRSEIGHTDSFRRWWCNSFMRIINLPETIDVKELEYKDV